jgi:hypothetical protein
VLLAEELALVAMDPENGRPALGTRSQLNACLAGLLIMEVALVDGGSRSPVLAAAAEVLEEKGAKPKSALSHMSRGLDQRLGAGTWDAVVGGLAERGVVAPTEGSLRPRNRVLDTAARDAVLDRLRAAAAGDQPMDARTAAVLSMTGPAQLLEVVAPDRRTRKHARQRIDHALESTSLQPVAESVRRVLADAAAAVAVAATTATVTTT